MRVEKDVYVTMRDGTGLAVDLYRPDDLIVSSAILMMTPYRKDPVPGPVPILTATGRRFEDQPEFSLDASQLSDLTGRAVQPYVERGFVVAVADARGTGFSEGSYDYYNLESGPYDGFDLVEWLSEQSWCSGKVGMMGASAGAIYAHLTAITAPPHLAAMATDMSPADFYLDQWRVGGVFRYQDRLGWALGMRANVEPIDPGEPGSPSYERKRAVYEARFRRYHERVAAGRGIVDLDWLTDSYGHRDYDEFWRRRSFLTRMSRVTVPTLHSGVWFDHFIRGTLMSYEAMNAPKMLVVAPGGLSTGAGELTELTLEWFEHFLTGVDTGILERPRARLYISGADEYIGATDWPVPTTLTELYLAAGPSGSADSVNDGLLSAAERPPVAGADTLVHDPAKPNHSPIGISDLRTFERLALTFTSAPLSEELTVVGAPRLVLYAMSDAEDVDWCVRLCDVDESGRSRLLNGGALKGSHVESHESPAPLVPGRVYRFEIEIWAIANLFKRGHRIRVDVSTSDYPVFEINPIPSVNRVLYGGEHPSRLILPDASNLRLTSPGSECEGRSAFSHTAATSLFSSGTLAVPRDGCCERPY